MNIEKKILLIKERATHISTAAQERIAEKFTHSAILVRVIKIEELAMKDASILNVEKTAYG